MSIKKSIFKIFNGTSWDEYYHKTSADQVVYTKPDGTASNVQTELAEQNANLKTNDSNSVIQIGKMRILFGSWVRAGVDKNYYKIDDAAGIKKKLKLEGDFDLHNFSCFVMNADGRVNSITCIGTQYWQNDGLYCYFDKVLKMGVKIRMNYVYVYFDDYVNTSF